MLLGIDSGSHRAKIVTTDGAFSFLSVLGEYRERNLDALGQDDMIVEYNGKKCFAGSLAKRDSYFVREMRGDTKAHEDAILRVLIAIHRHSEEYVNDVIVAQPIAQYNATEKQKIVRMLKGTHTMTINGRKKSFEIRQVGVSPEGAVAHWALREDLGDVYVIDIGSGTINLAAIEDGIFVDKSSTTIVEGANTTNGDLEAMAQAIRARVTGRWSFDRPVLVVGGIAADALPFIQKIFPKARILEPVVGVRRLTPMYANAVGLFNLGVKVYGR